MKKKLEKSLYLDRINRDIRNLRAKIVRRREKHSIWFGNQKGVPYYDDEGDIMYAEIKKLEKQLELQISQKEYIASIQAHVRHSILRETYRKSFMSFKQKGIDSIGKGDLNNAFLKFLYSLKFAGNDLNLIYEGILNIADLARRTKGMLDVAEHLFKRSDISLVTVSRFKSMKAMVYILKAEAGNELDLVMLNKHTRYLFEAIKIAETAIELGEEKDGLAAKSFATHRYLGTLCVHINHFSKQDIILGGIMAASMLSNLDPESEEGVRIRYSLAMIDGHHNKNYLEAAKELERCMEKALEFGWAMDAAPNAVHAAEFYFLANILTKAHDLYFKAEKYRKDMEKFSTDGEIIKRLDKLKKIFS
jgi:hypothetical protein